MLLPGENLLLPGENSAGCHWGKTCELLLRSKLENWDRVRFNQTSFLRLASSLAGDECTTLAITSRCLFDTLCQLQHMRHPGRTHQHGAHSNYLPVQQVLEARTIKSWSMSVTHFPSSVAVIPCQLTLSNVFFLLYSTWRNPLPPQ